MNPIHRLVRKTSPDELHISPTSYKISVGSVPSFTDVREYIYPIVKPWSWAKKARESLSSVEPKSLLVSKQISSLNLGILYGVCMDGNEDNVRYISSLDLDIWQIKEKDLIKYAKENLVKKVGLVEKNGPLFTETQTGIYYSNQLQNFTSSLLAMPEVFKMVTFKAAHNYSHVVLCPTADLLFVTHSHDTRGLCLVAELCFSLAKREDLVLHMKPIRVMKNSLSTYEASIVRNESHWPTSEEQLITYKKSAIKRLRKRSTVRLSDSV